MREPKGGERAIEFLGVVETGLVILGLGVTIKGYAGRRSTPQRKGLCVTRRARPATPALPEVGVGER